ncbi:MAG: substrate-binding domain-containing protein [Arcobacteraceae bacterium]
MTRLKVLLVLILTFSTIPFLNAQTNDKNKKLAYIVSDIEIPFWDIMARGIKNKATELGYSIDLYSSGNDKKRELEAVSKAINDKVAGIIVSPTTSSACVTILKLAKLSGIPVVISDIGTDSGDYVSYISSNNEKGAYDIGKVLALEMIKKGYEKGKVGIISIPQQRANGKARTAGFLKALSEHNIKSADLKQQVNFSYQETYDFSTELISKHDDLKAIWLQGSDKYKGALDAIEHAGKKDKILLITFDAEPEFLDMIPNGILVGAAMQQPFLMGQYSVETMDNHLKGKVVEKNLQLPILAVSTDNITTLLPIIKKNVLGMESK